MEVEVILFQMSAAFDTGKCSQIATWVCIDVALAFWLWKPIMIPNRVFRQSISLIQNQEVELAFIFACRAQPAWTLAHFLDSASQWNIKNAWFCCHKYLQITSVKFEDQLLDYKVETCQCERLGVLGILYGGTPITGDYGGQLFICLAISTSPNLYIV